jgi:hypothetical protein
MQETIDTYDADDPTLSDQQKKDLLDKLLGPEHR